MSAERTDEQVVKEKWPEAEADGDEGHAAIFVGMYQVSDWKATEADAWADVARRVERERGEG